MCSKNQFLFSVLWVLLVAHSSIAQVDNFTNSFEQIYQQTNPTLNYMYDQDKQIHNYSNNWDLDNDGVNDEVFFVGTGGAHLYYFLRIVLSSDKIVRDFSFLESDFPVLSAAEALTKMDFNPEKHQIQFAVFEFDKDNMDAIFIRLDDSSFRAGQKTLKRKGVKTNHIVLTFKNGKPKFRDFGSE